MKLLTLLTILLSSTNLFSQHIYFPSVNYTDSISLSKSMPALAKQVTHFYKDADKEKYWDNLFRYQIVSQEYSLAKNAIDSMKAFYNNPEVTTSMGIAYESYILTCQKQRNEKRSFDELFNLTLADLYNKLPDAGKSTVEYYFSVSLNELRDKFNALVQKQKASKRDSIVISEAQALCRAYNSYNVFSKIFDLGQAFLKAEEEKRYVVMDSVLIPTKDAQLSAVIVRSKTNSSPQPVVMLYNIYASDTDKVYAKRAADKGFVGVVVNTRGKHLSPQSIEPFEHDGADAYDVIDWISKQSWCNGKVGMYGGSYLGFSQWSAVKKIHPALKTIVPQVAVGIGIDYPLHNNVFMSYMLSWIHFVTNNKLTDSEEFYSPTKWNDLYKKWYLSGKSFRALDSLDGRPNTIFQRWLDHPSYDRFWYNMVPYEKEFSKINIPILTTTGYFDDDQRGALYYFKQHYKYNKNAEHYLLIGPYDHGGAQSYSVPYLKGYAIDSVANININDHVFQWFDYILKDGKKPAVLKDKINYQVMGANQWKHASSFDKMNKDTLTFYLSNVRTKSHYKLQRVKPTSKVTIEQEVDFTDRSDVDDINVTYEYLIVDSVAF
jgi:predicted acyl esterase